MRRYLALKLASMTVDANQMARPWVGLGAPVSALVLTDAGVAHYSPSLPSSCWD